MADKNWLIYPVLVIGIPLILFILYLILKIFLALVEGILHKIKQKIKYESELDQNFAQEISNIPGGETLFSCIQCGTCSATCPMSIYMDYTPRRIVAMTRAGFKDEVLRSITIWLCTSCYSCSVRCPRNLKITDFMYGLKQRAIQEKFYPKRSPIPALARQFFHSIQKHGRNNEGQLVTLLYLKINPLQILKSAKMGLKLFLRGRLRIKTQSIPGKSNAKRELKIILRAVEGEDIKKETS